MRLKPGMQWRHVAEIESLEVAEAVGRLLTWNLPSTYAVRQNLETERWEVLVTDLLGQERSAIAERQRRWSALGQALISRHRE